MMQPQSEVRSTASPSWTMTALTVILLAASAPSLRGQVTVGFLADEFIVRDANTSTQELGVAADGRSFHVWRESSDIYWRVFDAAGTPLTAADLLNTTTLDIQDTPSLAVRPDGSFFAVWDSDDGDDGLRGRYYDGPTDTLEANDKIINVLTPAGDTRTAVAALTGGGFVAVWDSFLSQAGGDTDGKSIQARRIGATGVPSGGQFQVNSVEAGWQYEADVTHQNDGGYFVVWRSGTSAGTDPSNAINGRRYDASGSPLGPDVQINTWEPLNQSHPRIATNEQGEMLAVWRSPEPGAGGLTYAVVRGRWLNPDGTPDGDDFLLSTRDDIDHEEADVTGTTHGFVVTWHRYFDPTSGDTHDVDARVVTGPGEFSTAPFKVDETASNGAGGDQFDPAVAAYSDRVQFTWRGENTFGAHHLGAYGRGFELCLFCDGFESGDTASW